MDEGNTFLLPKSSDDHLWAIISDPSIDPDHVVVLRFLSFHDYEYEQKSCVIYDGEHPFFKHATFVDYASAVITTNKHLEELKKTSHLKQRSKDLGAALLAKIRQAIPSSQIPLDCEKALESQGLLSD
jgi:hypothetical protein